MARFELRKDPSFLVRVGFGVGCLTLLFGVWAQATHGEPEMRRISPVVLPSPLEVLQSFPRLVNRFELLESTLISLRRVALGFGLAVLWSVPLGIFASSVRAVNAFFAPIVSFFRNTPMVTLLPLTVAWFHISETQKVAFIFMATFAFVFIDTVNSVSAIPERYVETARTLGATRSQIILNVLAPLAAPNIFTSVRFLLGLGFGYIILAEVVGLEGGGLGVMLMTLSKRGYMAETYMVVLWISVVAFSVDRFLHFFQRGIFPYRKDL